jgi:two-component system, LytTR family, sensor kinase
MKKQTLYKILIHLLFWVFFIYITVVYLQIWLPQTKVYPQLSQLVEYSIIYTILLASVPYFNYFVLVKLYYKTRRFFLYTLFLLASYVVGTLLICGLESILLKSYDLEWMFTMPHLISRVPYFVLFTLLGNWLLLSEEMRRKQELEKQLKTERTEAELKWLKAQISPHFLFNALNNIYSLVYFKEDNAAPMLVKLSNLMRYVFYEGNHEKVTIAKEVQYMEDYIELQLLKKKYVGKIHFTKELYNNTIFIEPMLFINFVENAFKHGNLDADEGHIEITLLTNENELLFTCKNNFDHIGIKDATTGIGLENIEKRLALLYPDQYNLTTVKKDKMYSARLQIQLKSLQS